MSPALARTFKTPYEEVIRASGKGSGCSSIEHQRESPPHADCPPAELEQLPLGPGITLERLGVNAAQHCALGEPDNAVEPTLIVSSASRWIAVGEAVAHASQSGAANCRNQQRQTGKMSGKPAK